MQAGYFDGKSSVFTQFEDFAVHVLLDLGHHFFNASRMNTAVFQQHHQRASRHFATEAAEATNGQHARLIIEQQINAGRLFEGFNITTFFTNDAAFHFLIGQFDFGRGGFGGVFCGVALNGAANDLDG